MIVFVADFHPSDFSTDGFGQFVYKLNDSRVFIRCSDLLDVVLQGLDQMFFVYILIVFCQYDSSFYDLSANFVGYACDGAFHYGRMRHQCALHLEGADAVAGTFDDIVYPSYKPEITVFVLPGYVACIIYAVMPYFTGEIRVTVVFLEQSQWFALGGTDDYLTLLARCG